MAVFGGIVRCRVPGMADVISFSTLFLSSHPFFSAVILLACNGAVVSFTIPRYGKTLLLALSNDERSANFPLFFSLYTFSSLSFSFLKEFFAA